MIVCYLFPKEIWIVLYGLTILTYLYILSLIDTLQNAQFKQEDSESRSTNNTGKDFQDFSELYGVFWRFYLAKAARGNRHVGVQFNQSNWLLIFNAQQE